MSWWRPWSPSVAAVVPVALLLWGVSVPGGYYDVLVAALVTWSLVGLAWLVTCVWCVRTLPRRRPRRPWRLWPLLTVPVVFAANWTVASGDLTGRVTFERHRAELERVAAKESTRPSYGHRDVGLYSFESIYTAHNCVLFAVSDPGMARSAGFAWCPGRVPMDAQWNEGQVFERFDGDWYVFIVRHELWRNRFHGADPWGIQITELTARTPT